MSDWRSCENCGDEKECWFGKDDYPFYGDCSGWVPIPCPRCCGALSTTREHNGRKYRHCYACHAEFFVDEGDLK